MAETRGLIFDIRKFSLHDGPGIRTTVFFKGCPLSCWWCHNPESQSPAQELMIWESRCVHCGDCVRACPVKAIEPAGEGMITDRRLCTVCGTCVDTCAAEAREVVGRRVTAAEVMREIERDRPFFEESGGGVTFSGGEPLAQRAFLQHLLQACKAQDLHTAVDTSGYAPWPVFESIRADTDLFLYDLKMIDDERHRRYTGVSNGLILSNLQALSALGHRIIVRVPIIPGINDDPENIGMTAAFCASLPGLERVDLLPYHPSAQGKYERLALPYRLPGTLTPAPTQLEQIASIFDHCRLTVGIGG